ncbi:MT-A70 family methyltransferase [Sedimentitalea sp. JM2-8]|uniref:MT-A70 family methyltransferase n=1 Tax=Sedimentitalea xiamensis TaxID=3050037 RepID=A0ABT7FCA0_9RHOB|nr:MT-A70 family methyltransferase [Sedimentitalea xiamensis]MDK3072743.1 MT-A70 family methyltransferase [Sedimentitalea xiamensis]
MSDWPFDTLTPMKYGAILADPPWAYAMRSEKGYEKSPEAHYATMSIEDIAALPVGNLAGPDCYLFLWSTWPHLADAMYVMDMWGFAYVTGGSWIKRTKNWNLSFGTGYVQRSACEPYLIGKIGRPQQASRAERNVLDCPDKIEALIREHSRKPPQMREMIDRLLPRAHFCEIFAREPWEGHDVWGNQTDRFGRPGGERDE